MGDLLLARVLEDLVLVVSELVTHAVLHGHGDVALHLAFDGEHVVGSVSDDGPGFAHDVHDRDPTRDGGQGLNLVSQLTTHWGMHPETSHVWFEVAAIPGH
jgi:anti-sigma regulatory factor (Ser/Thr protein kinase)